MYVCVCVCWRILSCSHRSGLHDGAVLPLPLLVLVFVAVLRRRALDELEGLQHGAGVRQLRFTVDTPANHTRAHNLDLDSRSGWGQGFTIRYKLSELD